jgi:hypothetical protein
MLSGETALSVSEGCSSFRVAGKGYDAVTRIFRRPSHRCDLLPRSHKHVSADACSVEDGVKRPRLVFRVRAHLVVARVGLDSVEDGDARRIVTLLWCTSSKFSEMLMLARAEKDC